MGRRRSSDLIHQSGVDYNGSGGDGDVDVGGGDGGSVGIAEITLLN